MSIVKQGAQLFNVSEERFQNWQWQISSQVRTLDEAQKILNLDDNYADGFKNLQEVFNIGITPYYMTLMSQNKVDCPIRLQALPQQKELKDLVGIKDPLDEVGHSPVKEVVHVYPDRVAFCVAQLCPVYCRYCFRKRRDDEVGLHFNKNIVKNGIDYIAKNSAIRDVLITGGDPFLGSDQTIDNLLSELRKIPHVEVIRFGTRTPVTLPYRITENLAKILAKYHPVWVNTHFNCAEEITPDAITSLNLLVNHGIPVGNQAVLLKGVNDTPEKMKELCRKLVMNRVRPYYVFHPHLVEGTDHLRTSITTGMKIMKSLQGNISGYAIPTYILDTPSGKLPMTPSRILGFDGNDLILEDVRGEIWREKDALREY